MYVVGVGWVLVESCGYVGMGDVNAPRWLERRSRQKAKIEKIGRYRQERQIQAHEDKVSLPLEISDEGWTNHGDEEIP
jgi:hypothetical protein